ncbi:MAG TPA: penicillin-binding protein 2 [Acidobacteriaceae bacterium]|jgi:penicillin-binding protein 2|nr:penicillin-binding protein 2 [Acidobacteriaceae bacterium]
MRLAAFQYVIAIVMGILVFGLWRLQVVAGQNYHAMAEANRIRKVPILAPRGKIFDREGRLIVDNYPSVSCFLVREQGHDIAPDLPLIARGLHMSLEQIDAILKKYRTAPKYQPLPLKQDITPDEEEFIEAHKDELPELDTVQEQRRLYPLGGFAAQLIGYVGEVSEEMLNDPRYAVYEPGDVVGRSGVEATYDGILRGVDGSQDVAVDSHGREIGQLGIEPAKPGKDLRLTIDLDIQRAAENALGDHNGAVIAMDPHTGEILALVSRPIFDPNEFAVRISRGEWNQLITDPNHPLMDKAIQAQLAPGSTFKIIMSLAGLQENVAQTFKVDCTGGATLYGHFFACDKRHGEVDIEHAIPWSCDTYFYELAARLGIDTIAKYAHSVGIGEKTGIDLPDEASGIMPSTEWKLRTFHEKWYAGETVSVGIGQGAVAVTPIQLLRAIAGIASGGALKRPHVVPPSELSPEMYQQILQNYPGSGDVTIQESPETWQIITEGMYNTVNGGGTAAASRLEGIDFAGKTGTAEVVSHSAGAKSLGTGNERANAWFVGIAPRRNPDIAVVVLNEHGGWGADAAAPIAAKVIEAYVDKQRMLHHNLIAQTPKPVQVGALWSNPGNPNELGGKPLPAQAGQPANAEVASIRAGHFVIAPRSAAAQTAHSR